MHSHALMFPYVCLLADTMCEVRDLVVGKMQSAFYVPIKWFWEL